jgi:hypothetical protein
MHGLVAWIGIDEKEWLGGWVDWIVNRHYGLMDSYRWKGMHDGWVDTDRWERERDW